MLKKGIIFLHRQDVAKSKAILFCRNKQGGIRWITMDKITRMLILYSKLVKGDEINKAVFCLENSCSPRSFDRDIEDIRLYLSESFSMKALSYDRSRNVYYIEGTKRLELESTEYLFIERILKDTAVLRQDEFDILMSHLLAVTENGRVDGGFTEGNGRSYEPPLHNKALLKMHGDLVSIIRRQKCIRIRYFKGKGEEAERDVIPCMVKYDLSYLYMVAFRLDREYLFPAYYRLDRIYSFEIVRSQTGAERERVRIYMEQYACSITQMYGGDFVDITLECSNDFYSYIHDQFRHVAVLSQDELVSTVRVGAFEEGFVRWMMGQPQEKLTVIGPESTKEKLMDAARAVIRKYGGKN